MPWTFAINGHFQAMIFGVIEIIVQYFYQNDYEREIINLSDGGILALDWYFSNQKDKQKSDFFKEKSQRPIVAIIPGVNGENNKLYMISLIKAACKNGYDLVCINYRGLGGVPLKVHIFSLIIYIDYKDISCWRYSRCFRSN